MLRQTARTEWLADLARDYRDASDDAAAGYEPDDYYEAEDDDDLDEVA